MFVLGSVLMVPLVCGNIVPGNGVNQGVSRVKRIVRQGKQAKEFPMAKTTFDQNLQQLLQVNISRNILVNLKYLISSEWN